MDKKTKKDSHQTNLLPISNEVITINETPIITAFEAGNSVVIQTPTNAVVIPLAKIQITKRDGEFISAKIVRRTTAECKDTYEELNVIYLKDDSSN